MSVTMVPYVTFMVSCDQPGHIGGNSLRLNAHSEYSAREYLRGLGWIMGENHPNDQCPGCLERLIRARETAPDSAGDPIGQA